MWKPSIHTVLFDRSHQLRRPFRLVWNESDHRPRFPVRLTAGFVLFLILAGAGNQFRPSLIPGDGPLIQTVNMITRQLPNAVGLTLAVVVAAVLIDRRRLTDLGFHVDQGWWRGLGGGTALGAGITLLSVGVGLSTGYYEFTDVVTTHQGLWWVLLAVGGAVFQLLFVIPEELFVRGYLITNITEGFDGVRQIPTWVAAGIGVLTAAGVFYVTHAAGKGPVFGVMMAGMSILLGLGYVVSGDLSVPIGIHFGANFAGVLVGTNAQPASLLRITSSRTIQESIFLPLEAVIVRLVGAVLGIALVVAWYRTVRGELHVVPGLGRPTLRWEAATNTSEE
ncbi:CPBP family intramembrane glutamic endopeptidase [Halobellus ordinarius]|uniref:CPBP family intramembrane glutamic endopeptidase n=1 Tax=Halobellus ordinarius TaxID=3075120 RepID=UPI0028805D7F|nr:CPBP family intramembrane glutamic endopeptidase [Halobellus sp. ZY16]